MRYLYLREMGMNDNNISTNIKNHRVRVLENIDVSYKGEKFNMFFEFSQAEHWNTRTTNKRNGKPLKHPVRERIVKDGLYMDTQFEKTEKNANREWIASYRHSGFESEIWNRHLEYTQENILSIINAVSLEKYDRIIFIEKEVRTIINQTGGYREKYILAENADFQKEGSSYMEITETWNKEHKIVRVNRQEWQPTGNGKKLVVTCSCDVDLVTGKITG